MTQNSPLWFGDPPGFHSLLPEFQSSNKGTSAYGWMPNYCCWGRIWWGPPNLSCWHHFLVLKSVDGPEYVAVASPRSRWYPFQGEMGLQRVLGAASSYFPWIIWGPYLQDSSSPQNLISSQLRSFLAVPMAMATSGQWWPEFPISENGTSIHPVLHVYRPMRHPSCPLSLTALNIEFMVVSYWFHLLILPTSLHLSLYLGSPQFRPPSSLAQRPATASSSALLRSTQDPSSPLPIYLPTLLKAQIWSYPPLLQTL